MNQYIASSLKVDLAQVIIRLCRGMIDTADFMQVITSPPANEEDLLDFIADDDMTRLQFALAVVKDLTVELSSEHIKVLTRQVIENSDHDEAEYDEEAWSQLNTDDECDTCGGILLKSCTCEP